MLDLTASCEKLMMQLVHMHRLLMNSAVETLTGSQAVKVCEDILKAYRRQSGTAAGAEKHARDETAVLTDRPNHSVRKRARGQAPTDPLGKKLVADQGQSAGTESNIG